MINDLVSEHLNEETAAFKVIHIFKVNSGQN